MSKLLKLKKWLTISEAAAHLSTVLKEPVTSADVLRLGLDRALTLSVYFVSSELARPGRPVPLEHAPRVPGLPVPGVPAYEVTLGTPLNENEVLVFEDLMLRIDGVFDLPMLGAEAISCEEAYQKLTNGPEVSLSGLEGTFLRVPNKDEYCQLYDSVILEAKAGDKRPAWERGEDLRTWPMCRLPESAVIVVRTGSIADFLANLSDPSEGEEKGVTTRERTTFLNIIGAMLVMLQHPRPSRRTDIDVIREMVESYGEKPGISERNLAKKFAEAKRSLGDM